MRCDSAVVSMPHVEGQVHLKLTAMMLVKISDFAALAVMKLLSGTWGVQDSLRSDCVHVVWLDALTLTFVRW